MTIIAAEADGDRLALTVTFAAPERQLRFGMTKAEAQALLLQLKAAIEQVEEPVRLTRAEARALNASLKGHTVVDVTHHLELLLNAQRKLETS